MWRAPLAKWRSRSAAISATGAPPSIAVGPYNQFAFPTLSYVAQLCPPIADMLRSEPFVVASLLHVPPQSFALADFHSLNPEHQILKYFKRYVWKPLRFQ